MAKSIRAVFDGEVLRPEETADLKQNVRYLVIIEPEDERNERGETGPYPLTEIGRLAIDMGVTDLSTRHSWYVHGRLENDGGDT